MPRSIQALIAVRTVSTPRLCPATRGMKRSLAQRPLPSIIMATCWGIMSASGIFRVELEAGLMGDVALSLVKLNCHQLSFLDLQCPIYFGDVMIGKFLNFMLATAFVIHSDFFLFKQVF